MKVKVNEGNDSNDISLKKVNCNSSVKLNVKTNTSKACEALKQD